MTTPAPYQPPTATPAGHADRNTAISHQADQLMAAINGITPTQHPDARPLATIGTTPPIPQPGRAAMSSGAVDYCARVLATGVATSLFSGSVALVMAVSQFADPVVCGIVFGAPIGLAVPIAALSSLARRAKEVVEAAPPEHHHHYTGTVYQDHRQDHRSTNTTTRGLIATTRNELPY